MNDVKWQSTTQDWPMFNRMIICTDPPIFLKLVNDKWEPYEPPIVVDDEMFGDAVIDIFEEGK